MTDSERTFIGGRGNPERYGWPLRASSGTCPDPEQIACAATLLDREPYFIDDQGYECEIVAAAVHPKDGRIASVESRAKDVDGYVDIAIKIHLSDADGKTRSVDIESYNPFFGCDVRHLAWFDDAVALLVYREKHWTFVYRIGDAWPPPFIKIEDRWMIRETVLYYRAYRADAVQRLCVPSLERMPPFSLREARAAGCLPAEPHVS